MDKLTVTNGTVEIAGGFGRRAAIFPLSAITEYRPRNGYRSLYIQVGSKTHTVHGSPDEIRGYIRAIMDAFDRRIEATSRGFARVPSTGEEVK